MGKKNDKKTKKMDGPVCYRIVVQGGLEELWSERLGGLKITIHTRQEGSVLTELSGEVLDQSALFGVLSTLFNLRMPLVSVECTQPEMPSI